MLKQSNHSTFLTLFFLVCAACGTAVAEEEPRTLQNMERERSLMVDAMLNPGLSPDQRHVQLATAQRRLVDLERIVLRDPNIVGHRSVVVRRAFANYDLTFLVHASAENSRHLTDHWLTEMGISTATLSRARKGRR